MKKELIQKALDYYEQGYHCSQVILMIYSERINISMNEAIGMGACLGYGMNSGGVCGACSGALIVIGSIYNQRNIDESLGRIASEKMAERFLEIFRKRNTGIDCDYILGNINAPKEYMSFLCNTACHKMIIDSIDILEEYIL